jgi:hypothetical protein
MIQVLIFNSLVSELNNNDKGMVLACNKVHEYKYKISLVLLNLLSIDGFSGGHTYPKNILHPFIMFSHPHLEKFALPRNLNVHCII